MTVLNNCRIIMKGFVGKLKGRWRSLTITLINIFCKWQMFIMSCSKSMREGGGVHAAQGNRMRDLSCSFLNERIQG